MRVGGEPEAGEGRRRDARRWPRPCARSSSPTACSSSDSTSSATSSWRSTSSAPAGSGNCETLYERKFTDAVIDALEHKVDLRRSLPECARERRSRDALNRRRIRRAVSRPGASAARPRARRPRNAPRRPWPRARRRRAATAPCPVAPDPHARFDSSPVTSPMTSFALPLMSSTTPFAALSGPLSLIRSLLFGGSASSVTRSTLVPDGPESRNLGARFRTRARRVRAWCAVKPSTGAP